MKQAIKAISRCSELVEAIKKNEISLRALIREMMEGVQK